MKIENYSFGKMTIDGKTFSSDLLIVNESILPEWWRAQGHGLSMNDIVCILQINIKTFVLGCGFSSTLKISLSTRKALLAQKIHLIDISTSKAVEVFNNCKNKKETAFGFHLTC